MGEEAQRIEPVVDGDDDDATRRETRAVVARFGARADDEAAAVNQDHHRQLGTDHPARPASRR